MQLRSSETPDHLKSLAAATAGLCPGTPAGSHLGNCYLQSWAWAGGCWGPEGGRSRSMHRILETEGSHGSRCRWLIPKSRNHLQRHIIKPQIRPSEGLLCLVLFYHMSQVWRSEQLNSPTQLPRDDSPSFPQQAGSQPWDANQSRRGPDRPGPGQSKSLLLPQFPLL